MTDTSFQIRTEWPKAPQAGARDVAHLSILVGTNVLTQLAEVEKGAVRHYLRASAVTLALWFADNWWRLRWESLRDNRRPSADWRLRHELTSISGGTAWPPVMIYSAGERIVVAPAFGANVSSGPVRYLELGAVHAVSGDSYEEGLDAFFDAVLGACIRAQDGPALAMLVDQVRQERGDAETAAWRRLEACLGYDADEAPSDLIESLSAMEDRLGASAVEEAAVAAPGARAQETLKKAVDASEASEVVADLAIADAFERNALKLGATPWQRGEDDARAIREAIGTPHGPISNKTFGEMVGVEWATLKSATATAGRLPYGARLRTGKASQKLALQTKTGVDRRFEIARMLGDALWTSGESLGVISRAKTERQKFQRAFAQSLLCPFSDLRRQINMTEPTEEQIVNAARDFQVRPSVVQTSLVNKGVLPRETLDQRLEAA